MKKCFTENFNDRPRCPRSQLWRTRASSGPNHQPSSVYRAGRAARPRVLRAGSKTPVQEGSHVNVRQGYWRGGKAKQNQQMRARWESKKRKKAVLGGERRPKCEPGKAGREERVAGPTLARHVIRLAARVRRRIAPPPLW